jgi:hypothetical protein
VIAAFIIVCEIFYGCTLYFILDCIHTTDVFNNVYLHPRDSFIIAHFNVACQEFYSLTLTQIISVKISTHSTVVYMLKAKDYVVHCKHI